MLAGFELATKEPRVAGINLVQPEDDPVAVRDFSLQLSMLDFLHGLYPTVRIALHAGEIVEGLVPPEVLRFHIRDSIGQGHALHLPPDDRSAWCCPAAARAPSRTSVSSMNSTGRAVSPCAMRQPS